MQKFQAWKMLAGILVVFWLFFASILIIGNFPFLIISMALTTVAGMSILVTALAWAYQHDF